MDLDDALQVLAANAGRLFPKSKVDKYIDRNEGEASVSVFLPESSEKLLDLLIHNQPEFIRCMVGHFESLMGFVPVLDKIFAVPKQKRH